MAKTIAARFCRGISAAEFILYRIYKEYILTFVNLFSRISSTGLYFLSFCVIYFSVET